MAETCGGHLCPRSVMAKMAMPRLSRAGYPYSQGRGTGVPAREGASAKCLEFVPCAAASDFNYAAPELRLPPRQWLPIPCFPPRQ